MTREIKGHPHFLHRWILVITTFVMPVLVGVFPAIAQDDAPLSVPAEFERSLSLPGHGDHIRRPMALFEDPVHGEIVVADAGRNRLVFFDRSGIYRFEFDCADHIGSPIGVAVDSQGFVYVLGTSTEGRVVLRYDFDGYFLSRFESDVVDLTRIQAMSIDERDRLVLLDDDEALHVIGVDGSFHRTIDVRASLDEGARAGLVVGSFVADEGELFVPVSTIGTVMVFDIESGEHLRNIGYAGNTAGQLNFPAVVDVLPSGIVTVLDKMRFAVVCFSPEGRFLGEFGGKGFRDGWFYHPSLMIATESNEVIVGQIFESRIQVLRVPDMIRSRLQREVLERRVDVGRSRAESRPGETTSTQPNHP